MKINKPIVLSLLLLSAISTLGQVSSRGAGKDTRVEQAVRQLNSDEVQALLHNDAKTMERLWSEDFVVTNPLNKFVTKKDVLQMVKTGFLAFTSYERNIDYVRIYGDTAIVAGHETVVWAGKIPIAGKTNQLRFTAVWMKQGGRWQQVARHANIIVPLPRP